MNRNTLGHFASFTTTSTLAAASLILAMAGCVSRGGSDSQVNAIEGATCGNSVLEEGEDCDDGNATNLDGCDSACKFEQEHRINYLVQQFTTDEFCPDNLLGAAIVNQLAQNQTADSITKPV